MKYQPKDFQYVMLLKLIRLQRYRHQDGGFILFVVVAMVLILSSLLATYSLLSKTETSSTKASVSSNTGFYTAEAGLNLRAQSIEGKFNGYNRPTGTPPQFLLKGCLTNTGSQGSGDFNCVNVTSNNQKLLTYVTEDSDNPFAITIAPGELFAGLSAQEYRYDVTSAAVNSQSLPTAILGMRFKSRLVPLFQFVAFFDNDLDFFIPPQMDLNGPMHTNGNLYVNAAIGSTLTINGQVSTVGALYRGAKDSNTCSGTVNIYNATPAASPLNCIGAVRTAYNQSAVSSWGNMIRVGVQKLTVPPPEALDPTLGQVYWDKADLRIVLTLNASGNPSGIEVRNQNQSVDTTVTNNLLNNCPVTSVTLNSSANYSNATNTVLNVKTSPITAGFVVGDVVTVGSDLGPDYDSNVIASMTPTTITLKRQLGHSYQTAPYAALDKPVRKAVVSASNTFYNYREKTQPSTPNINDGKFIRMLNVDIRGLLNCANSLNLMGRPLSEDTDGGLVWFLTVRGPNSDLPSNTYGVRVYNGEYLYSNQNNAPEILGLTIVSDQALYIKGDYNRRDDPLTTGINEGDDPATPATPPTPDIERKRPAAFLADTINVLSNAWNMDDSASRIYDNNVPKPPTDTTGTTIIDNRNATATTINAAFLAGTEITGNANGTAGQDVGLQSGGLNNYPRFHEDWGGVIFRYRGSFVSLNRPQHVNSPYCGSSTTGPSCNIYTPPLRRWDFDTDFSNAANLPPLTPRFVYLRQEVFSRNFER